jgi:uncharacterized protein YabN with tetrapyrrole methylase and pyrophosphatase domain
MAARGSLTVVGSGIRAIGHMTLESHAHIKHAEKLLVLVADPLTNQWLSDQNPTAESLDNFYGKGKDRMDTYLEMVGYILSFVRAGQRVCAVFDGHPGVFAFPSHESVRLAREEGFHAEMLAGVSADACLYADLGVDPAEGGCQSFEATDFLVRHRGFDPHNQLLLWQVSAIGMIDLNPDFDPRHGLSVLVGRLSGSYPDDHPVTVYEASPFAACNPKIVTVALQDLPSAEVTAISTLYIPPVADLKPDDAVLELLGISAEDRSRRRESERRRMRGASRTARPATTPG